MAKAESTPTLLPADEAGEAKGPVGCLGMTFDSEDERRAYFLERLKEKLPELRQREDFPIGSDDDILRLSDPPYYTACPNPFLSDFVAHYGHPYDSDEPYHREPFAVDVSEGKNDPLYKAHGYHTKVPYRAIVPSILHYTKPDDLILDGFCGSGMTGVAAQWCGAAPLSYRMELEGLWKAQGREPPEWGARRAVLSDLSPAATFIAANYNIPFDVDVFREAAEQLLSDLEAEVGWMYETLHSDGKTKARINYTVWSEVFSCPECAGEVVFLEEALDKDTKRTLDSFPCPHCSAKLTKRNLQRSFESGLDPASKEPWKRISLQPVLINYSVGKARCEKAPDERDLALMQQIKDMPLAAELPTAPIPLDDMYHGSRLDPKGFNCIHHLFLPRGGQALAAMWRIVDKSEQGRLRGILLFMVEQAIWGMSVLNRYQPIQHGRPGGSQVNRQLSGVYYVSSQIAEVSPWYNLGGKLKRLSKAFGRRYSQVGKATISSGDCSNTGLPADSVDYVFTDPPFGENIHYADLNYVVESWHGVFTASAPESIIDQAKGKTLADYKRLMQDGFAEYRRVLKPGRWITVVFHNSRSAVWNAIQESMLAAGFVVADVRTLDKQQGSYRQVTSTAVKQDLVISAYKPNGGLEQRFQLSAGAEEGAWDFVRTHLANLPVFVTANERVEVVAERQGYMLFDRMVAFHVQRGTTVPLSAPDFNEGLIQRFPERDGMFFLPGQVVEYDQRRIRVRNVAQLELFVRDEESAIQWLRRELARKPRSFQDIHPDFIPELGGWLKHERMLELSDLLAENFLRYSGIGDVPPQIHAYLSTNFKDLRNLTKDHSTLRAKAKDRWYVPDPNKASDLAELRERSLLREFDEYGASEQRRLRLFRLEAVRAGFRRAWQNQDYAAIVQVASKIPEAVLHEDPKLLMWFDQASVRVDEKQSTQ